MKYKLSIIVPAYNLENTINKTLDSIFSQSTNEVEVIVVNDGSSDRTLEILNKYKIDNLVIINQCNSGPIKARFNGVDYSKGEYIWFVDGGDEINRGSIDMILDIIKDEPDILVFDYERVGENSNDIIHQKVSNNPLCDLFIGNISPSVWSKVFKKRILDGVDREIHSSFGEDLYISVHCFLVSNKIIYSRFNAYKYIYDSVSITSTGKGRETIVESIFNIKKEIENHNKYELYKEYFDYLSFNQLIINIYLKNGINDNSYYRAYKDMGCSFKNNRLIKYGQIIEMIVILEINSNIFTKLVSSSFNFLTERKANTVQ